MRYHFVGHQGLWIRLPYVCGSCTNLFGHYNLLHQTLWQDCWFLTHPWRALR